MSKKEEQRELVREYKKKARRVAINACLRNRDPVQGITIDCNHQ